MNSQNYQRDLEQLIKETEEESRIPRLFLHSCCAPCSSYVLEYLSRYFEITVFYYNPNISPAKEYQKRANEQRELIAQMPSVNPVIFIEGAYEPERFYQMAKGMEEEPEGGVRCEACYRMRLLETAKLAAEGGYDYFATTLTISPMKNAQKLNEIGEELGEIYQVRHLPSDFKKRNGYKRSVELSGQYGLYRQDYCGCVYSRRRD